VTASPSAGPASDRARAAFLEALVHDDPVALYETAPCGFLTTTPDGVIVKTNATLRTWLGREAADLVGIATFADLLTVGGRMYHETHVAPMLLMHGKVQEVALELVRSEGTRLPVLVNATLDRGEDGHPRAIRVALFDVTERRRYERELLDAKQRAEASEQEARALARVLQQTLIPPAPPVIPGMDLAAAYHPAGHGAEVGGDFYDVFRLGPDEWVVTLGDVCGKGYDAAIVTTLVRHTIRALTVGERSPARVLAGLDEVLRNHDTDRFCTAVVLHLAHDADGWQLTTALGGHPAPLLVRRDGTVEGIGGRGPLLGVLDEARFADERLRLEAGDAVLLYTDGVLEGRRGPEMFGEERLRATIEQVGAHPAELVAEVVRGVLEFQDGTLRDDVALVAFGVPEDAASGPAPA
jgi:sigma-B regulation protein RsbU (phosphoserine phosphatase)